MRITLQHVSKSFGRETVVRDLSHVLEPCSRTALLGPNGSGKSTLLQLIGGFTIPSKGRVVHELRGTVLDPEHVYRHISIAAPYLAFYEELPLAEVVATHQRFKALRNGMQTEDIIRTALLEGRSTKKVRDFSSGMKQRLKLALAILSDTPLLLLDEPASNLDAQGVRWFRALLLEHLDGRTLVVASNRQEEETFACDRSIEVAAGH